MAPRRTVTKTSKTTRLTAAQKLLISLAYGGRIERRPNRPFPAVYTAVTKNDWRAETPERTDKITESVVLKLVDQGFIKGEAQDALWDLVIYRVTEAGRREVERLNAQDMPSERGAE